jgi:hypothetical protein
MVAGIWRSWRDLAMDAGPRLLPVIGLAATSLLAIAALTLQPGPAGEPVAVLFAPFTDADMPLRRVAAAGGEILRHGAAGSIVIARSDAPDFATRLYTQGALLVASGLAAWACAPATRPSS